MSKPRTPRERLPWFPTIKRGGCLRDLECLNFCPADVFDWDPATGEPFVARPFDCIPGCRSCAENCKGKSISLPGEKEVAAALERIRAEDGPRSRGEGMKTFRLLGGSSPTFAPTRPDAPPQRKGVRKAKLLVASPTGKGRRSGPARPQTSNKNRAQGNKRQPGNDRSVVTFTTQGNKAPE